MDNMETVDAALEALEELEEGLLFVNLVEFDMVHGHRRNVEGYARALEDFDGRIPEILASLGRDDLLVITADHGCDPTYKGTDHTREYVPLLIYGDRVKKTIIWVSGKPLLTWQPPLQNYWRWNLSSSARVLLEKYLKGKEGEGRWRESG